MQNINSIIKKTSTIIKNGSRGIEAIKEGVHNLENYNKEVEELANERVQICVSCKYYKEEPNNLLKVDDTLILEADQMMCNDCGCSLPYKLRQSLIKCNKWQK